MPETLQVQCGFISSPVMFGCDPDSCAFSDIMPMSALPMKAKMGVPHVTTFLVVPRMLQPSVHVSPLNRKSSPKKGLPVQITRPTKRTS